MDPATFIDIDAAVSLMAPEPEDKSVDTAPEVAPEPAAAEPTTETQPEATGDTNTPADDTGATTDETADQGALPIIEPPSSWKTEEKDVFKTLPRVAQEAIARREQDRTTELRSLQNTTAEQRKTLDAETSRLKGLSDQITSVVQERVGDLIKDFPDIKTQADVEALAVADPARFVVFQAKLMRFNSAQQQAQDAQRELAGRAEVAQRETMQAARESLIAAFPTWTDNKIGLKEMAELQDYAISQGATEQGARNALDPTVYKLAQKAMLYDKAQAAKTAGLTKVAPKVIPPGTSNSGSKGDRNNSSRQSMLDRLSKTGDLDDALGLLRA